MKDSDTKNSSWAHCAVVVALALASHTWVLNLPFQLDDYTHIEQAPDLVEALGVRLASGGQESGPAPAGGYFFRPTMWLMFMGERALSGAIASPVLFHGVSWLLHGVITLLVWQLLAALVSRPGATVGAAFFALHPAGTQAVSWVSARGDQLLTLFAVLAALAVLRLWRRKTSGMALICGVAVAAAVCSKMSALVLVPLALLAVFIAPAGIGVRMRRVLLCLLPIILAVGARWTFLGTLMPTYVAGTSFGLEAAPRMISRAPSMGLQILMPWNRSPEAAEFAPSVVQNIRVLNQLLPGYVLLLGPLMALFAAPIRHGGRALPALAVFVFCALPPLFIWKSDAYTGLSRTHYLLMVPLAVIWASAAWTMWNTRRRGAWALKVFVVFWLVLHAAVSLDALRQSARIEAVAGRGVRTRLHDIQEIADRVGRNTWFVVVDPKADFAGMPVLGALIEKAVLPPFTNSRLRVKHVHSTKEIMFRELLTNLDGPVQVIEFHGGHLQKTGPLLPAIPSSLPGLISVNPPGRAVWEPESPLPVRAVAGVTMRFAPGMERLITLEVLADGRPFSRQLHVPGSRNVRELVVALDDDFQFLLTARLERIRFLHLPSPIVLQTTMEPPMLLRSIPELRLLAPEEGARVSIADNPEFRVGRVAGAATLRLSLYFWLPPYYRYLKCTFTADQIKTLPDGVRSCTPTDQVRQVSDYPGLAWNSVPAHLDLLLRDFGIRQIMVRWRVEALDLGGQNVIARSPWSLFFLRK